MKNNLLYSTLFIAAFCFISCAETGYVSAEPTYVEIGRPIQPSPAHIWIDGDWVWQSQNRVYVRNEGHWDMPRHGRTYTQGHWESNGKGHHWIPGKWH